MLIENSTSNNPVTPAGLLTPTLRLCPYEPASSPEPRPPIGMESVMSPTEPLACSVRFKFFRNWPVSTDGFSHARTASDATLRTSLSRVICSAISCGTFVSIASWASWFLRSSATTACTRAPAAGIAPGTHALCAQQRPAKTTITIHSTDFIRAIMTRFPNQFW